MASRGILSYGVHLPYRRLDRSEIRPVAGTGGGTGTRTVASYDEDTTTMGVEADRVLVAGSQARAVAGLARKLGVGDKVDPVGDRLAAAVGFTGAAHPALLL